MIHIICRTSLRLGLGLGLYHAALGLSMVKNTDTSVPDGAVILDDDIFGA